MTRADSSLRVPEPIQQVVEQILSITDPFCAEHLDAEYSQLVSRLVVKLARKRPSPLARGQLRIWAAAAVYAIGSVNFLFDPAQRPHLTGDNLSILMGVPKSTLVNKAKSIRDLLNIGPLEPEWCRRPNAFTSPHSPHQSGRAVSARARSTSCRFSQITSPVASQTESTRFCCRNPHPATNLRITQ